jgi:superfamily I DNA/RNA helicase
VLIAYPTESDGECIEGTNIKVNRFVNAKIKLLCAESDVHFVVVRSERAMRDVLRSIRYFKESGIKKAPAFDYAPCGEMKQGSMHISKRFYQLVEFVENFGLDFQSWASNACLQKGYIGDKVFVKACQLYHQAFQEYLDRRGLVTFNQMFMQFHPDKMDLVYEGDKCFREKITHLLMDEFQDICPLYVNFIKSIKYSLQGEADQAGTFMSVGDDFQAIYGWKGSLVDFISQFDSRFESYDPHLTIDMVVNYRCSQRIIDFAEEFIRNIPVGVQTVKHGRASVNLEDDPVPRVFVAPSNTYDQQAASLIKKEARIIGATEKEPLYVLYRTSSAVDTLKSKLSGRKNIKFMTFHASKGLEAESVILIGDCFVGSPNPIKNDVLRQFRRDQSSDHYNKIQEHEAMRLAYVAATRAARRCYWILPPEKHTSKIHGIANSSAKKGLCEFIKVAADGEFLPISMSKKSNPVHAKL